MDKKQKRIEDFTTEDVVNLLERSEMGEFIEFVKEKDINGLKLLAVSEGIVKLWRPKSNAKKFIAFIDELKTNPEKYLNSEENNPNMATIEAQYQTVKVKKVKEQHFTSSSGGVEEILRRIVPAKSFLYRNQSTLSDKPVAPYVPMDAGTPKKNKKLFRFSWYEYPVLDKIRISKTEQFNDRGYYSIKTNSKHYFQKTTKRSETKKYTSLPNVEELKVYPDEHFYEDLNYNDLKKEGDDLKENKPNEGTLRPRIEKIQVLFQNIKLPFFKKADEVEEDRKHEAKESSVIEKDNHIYENSDSAASMYDSIHVPVRTEDSGGQPALPVEDYLEPVQLNKDYSDVAESTSPRQRDDSILGYILSLFDNFSLRRKADTTHEEDEENSSHTSSPKEKKKKQMNTLDTTWKTNMATIETTIEQPKIKMADKPQLILEKPRQSKMADRPVPVPAENEPYFMDIDRNEAENLLAGQPDGAFVLRPSSQPNHAYTLTVSCSNAVHNVGVRRRPDGRLALGFARRGERTFETVTSLIRHHRTRKLLLVAGGGVCGATTLNDTPQYYQTPSSLPPNHAYTLTVSCSNAVHNVGVRRRPDGRLALGFARRGERTFETVTSLIRHHRTRKLLLVAGGGVCGATTLNDTPQYYQTPSSLPV